MRGLAGYHAAASPVGDAVALTCLTSSDHRLLENDSLGSSPTAGSMHIAAPSHRRAFPSGMRFLLML